MMRGGLIAIVLILLAVSPVFATGKNEGSSAASAPIVPLATQVTNIYNFALLIGGLLAFGAVVYGAARYTLSAGSPSGQSDARDQIAQALLGLVLLLGAYIVLNTINPSLTKFNLPQLKEIKPAENTSGAAAQNPGKGCVISLKESSIIRCSSKGDCSDINCGGAACVSLTQCPAPTNN